jgi:hypothetical protein
VRGARAHYKPLIAFAVAQAAWLNYWELCQEAERIRWRLTGRPSSPRAESSIAPGV